MSGRTSKSLAGRASGAPYRAPVANVPDNSTDREFLYAPVNETSGRDGLLVLLRLFSLPLMLATGAGWFAGGAGAIAGLVVGAAFGAWSWQARKKVRGAVLRVEGELLTVVTGGRRVVKKSLRLGDLADVALDLKTIERVMDGAAAIPAVRLIDSKVGPKLDTARLVLVDANGREVCLTDDYLPYSEATHWLGKVRMFLRKNRWVPEDEREDGGVATDTD